MKNTTNIPRYKASFPLQTEFVTNANSCGDHIFNQVARKGNVAVYKRTKVEDGLIAGFETIIIKTVKAGTVYAKGAVPTLTDTESYPGEASFGRLAFACSTETRALEKMEELLTKDVEEKDEPAVTIPSNPFTLVEFAGLNGLPVTQETASLVTKLLKDQEIEFVGTQTVNNKPVQFFSKV